MPKIQDIAVICRSKNANPFLLTLDVVFPRPRDLRQGPSVRRHQPVVNLPPLQSGGKRRAAGGVPPPANAFKATIPRLHGSGSPQDSDVYGAQQHGPLMDVELPI